MRPSEENAGACPLDTIENTNIAASWQTLTSFLIICPTLQVWDACSDAIITFNEDLYDTEVAFIVENDLLVHAVSERLSEKPAAQTLYETRVDKVFLPSKRADNSKIILDSGKEVEAKLLVSPL